MAQIAHTIAMLGAGNDGGGRERVSLRASGCAGGALVIGALFELAAPAAFCSAGGGAGSAGST